MDEITLGRKGNQLFEITDPKVSSRHLKVTRLRDSNVRIEDLGSSNGTFVDGVRIVRKVVSEDTIVVLGGSYHLRIGDAFKESEFDKLNAIYDEYTRAKIKIQQDNARKQFLRSLPGVLSTVIMALTNIVGDSVGELRPVIGVVMLVCIALSITMAYRGQQGVLAKMEELNKQFMVDYVCPMCKNFLGFLPFENLRNKGCCPKCNKKWK